LRIKQFNANASKETRDAIKDLETKKVAGYVLDLRSNPGGLLESSIDISRHFINKGVIVSTVSKDGLKETKRGNGQALTKKPLVVLVPVPTSAVSPSILITCVLTLVRSILRFSSTLAATPSPSLIKPNRRCSVPM